MKYYFHIIKSTILNTYFIQFDKVQSCNYYLNQFSECFPQSPCTRFQSPLPSQATLIILPFLDFHLKSFTYSLLHIVCSLLHMASFTLHDAFVTHPCCYNASIVCSFLLPALFHFFAWHIFIYNIYPFISLWMYWLLQSFCCNEYAAKRLIFSFWTLEIYVFSLFWST